MPSESTFERFDASDHIRTTLDAIAMLETAIEDEAAVPGSIWDAVAIVARSPWMSSGPTTS